MPAFSDNRAAFDGRATAQDDIFVVRTDRRLSGFERAMHRARQLAGERLDRSDSTPVEVVRQRDSILIARFLPLVRAGRVAVELTEAGEEYGRQHLAEEGR